MKRDELKDCRHCGHAIVPCYGGWMHVADSGLSLHCPGAKEAEPSDDEAEENQP